MARKNDNAVSDFFKEKRDKGQSLEAELIIREAFLRMAKEEFDGAGIETWTVDHVRGALMLLEKFTEIKEEL